MLCNRQDEKGLPPTPDTLHLGCSYHLHSSHRFLSTWGVVMLEKNNNIKTVKICRDGMPKSIQTKYE